MMDNNVATESLSAYVPAGDRRLVLSAIDNQLNVAKESWRQKNSIDKQPNNNNNSREEFFMKCIDETGKSLKQQIESVTVPADETEVERVLDSFQTRLLSTKPSSDCDDDDDDDDESLSSVDDINEEIEFDDNEIVDQDAYNQVKQLRAQARDISSRIISIREETAGKALDMTRRDITEVMKLHGFTENLADDTTNNEDEEQEDNEGASSSNNLNPMNVALQTLSASLKNVDTDLADKLESLKETIGTIDSSVEKYQRMSQGDESALSQTEKALLASDDEPRQRGVVDSTGDDSDDSPMNPDKKLARLLAGVL